MPKKIIKTPKARNRSDPITRKRILFFCINVVFVSSELVFTNYLFAQPQIQETKDLSERRRSLEYFEQYLTSELGWHDAIKYFGEPDFNPANNQLGYILDDGSKIILTPSGRLGVLPRLQLIDKESKEIETRFYSRGHVKSISPNQIVLSENYYSGPYKPVDITYIITERTKIKQRFTEKIIPSAYFLTHIMPGADFLEIEFIREKEQNIAKSIIIFK